MALKSNQLPRKILNRIAPQLAKRSYEPIPKPTKYGNVKEEGWDSQGERKYYKHLLIRERAGDIHSLTKQVRVDLHVGKRFMKIDFHYFDNNRNEWVWDDFKGFPTPEWLLKMAIWGAGFGPGTLLVTKKVSGGYHSNPVSPKVHPETLRNILRCAKATMAENDLADQLKDIAEGSCG